MADAVFQSAGLASAVDTSFIKEYFDTLGIDPRKDVDEYRSYQLATYSWSRFAEKYLPNPMKWDEPIVLEAAQRSAINSIQFGYDISMFPWTVPERMRPKEVVMLWPRQFGKTEAVAAAAAAAFIFMDRPYEIATWSINEDRAKSLLARIRRFIVHSPFAYMVDDENKLELFKKGGKVHLKAYPANDSCRGEAIHLGLVDEAAQIADGIVNGAILYCMRRVGQRCILLSTPFGSRGALAEHYFVAMKTRPLVCKHVVGLDEHNRPIYCQHSERQDSPLMAKFYHKFTTYEVPENLPACPKCNNSSWVYGIGEYAVIPVDPWHCSWKTPEEIQHELDLAGNTPLARQEILGEIIMEGANVFSEQMLNNCVDMSLTNSPRPRPDINNYVIGMDFGKVHDNSVMCVMHKDYTTMKVIFDHMFTIKGQYGGIDYHDIRKTFLEFCVLFNPMWVVPDATGVGDAIVDEMYRDLKALRLRASIFSNKAAKKLFSGGRVPSAYNVASRKGFIFDVRSKVDLINYLIDGYAKRHDISIPPRTIPEIGDFWAEMLSFGYEVTESGVQKQLRFGTQAYHDDRVIAHALAYLAAGQKPFIESHVVMG